MAGCFSSPLPSLLPLLDYKRSPRHPLPPHTSSATSSSSIPFHRVQRSSISAVCQLCPATETPVHMPFPDDLAIKILQTFSSRCTHVSPTTYPKIAARGDPMQPGADSQWQLPCVCMRSARMTGILVLVLVHSDISLIHQPHPIVFPDVLYVSAGALSEISTEAPRNVIGVQSAVLRPWHVLMR